MSVKGPVSRLMRWRNQLEYDEIVYKHGVQNYNAYARSRINTFTKEKGEPNEINTDMKVKIVQENHDSIVGGHRGMNKTYEAIEILSVAEHKEVEEYVKIGPEYNIRHCDQKERRQ